MSGRCLESVWKVHVMIPEVVWNLSERVWEMPKVVFSVSEMCFEAILRSCKSLEGVFKLFLIQNFFGANKFG